MLFHVSIDLFIKFLEVRHELRAPVLIADTEIVKFKRHFVSHFPAERRPLIACEINTDCKIDQVNKILDVFFAERPSCRIGIIASRLAEHATRHDRKRHRTEILGELEIFHISDTHRHGVAPDVVILLAALHRADRILPVVHIIPDVRALRNASARKPKKCRL